MADFKFAIVLYVGSGQFTLVADKTYVELKANGELFKGKVTRVDSVESGDFEIDGVNIDPEDVEEVLYTETIR